MHRPADRADDPQPVLDALAGLALPDGDGFVWIAAEAHVTRAVRDYVRGALKHAPNSVKASGYWIKCRADANEKFEE